jgi:hypothetical protein
MYLYVAGGSVLALHTQSKETEVHSGAIERDPPDNGLRERSKRQRADDGIYAALNSGCLQEEEYQGHIITLCPPCRP